MVDKKDKLEAVEVMENTLVCRFSQTFLSGSSKPSKTTSLPLFWQTAMAALLNSAQKKVVLVQ